MTGTYFHLSTAPLETPSTTHTGPDDEIIHIECCLTEGVALCGTELADSVEDDDFDPDCVVCVDLYGNAPHVCPVRAFCPLYTAPV